jgi:hypothetical protein
MFISNMAFSLALMALTFGTALLIWSQMQKNYKTLSKIISYIVIIVAALGILCNFVHAVKAAKNGYWSCPHCKMMQNQQNSNQIR